METLLKDLAKLKKKGMPESRDVTANDKVLASQYNSLRNDALLGGRLRKLEGQTVGRNETVHFPLAGGEVVTFGSVTVRGRLVWYEII